MKFENGRDWSRLLKIGRDWSRLWRWHLE